ARMLIAVHSREHCRHHLTDSQRALARTSRTVVEEHGYHIVKRVPDFLGDVRQKLEVRLWKQRLAQLGPRELRREVAEPVDPRLDLCPPLRVLQKGEGESGGNMYHGLALPRGRRRQRPDDARAVPDGAALELRQPRHESQEVAPTFRDEQILER